MSVTISGSGQIIKQVVQTVKTDTFSTSSTSYVSTGHAATITPTSATSKVLAIYTATTNIQASNTAITCAIYRGATNVTGDAFALYGAAGGWISSTTTISYLDSPATTSATTYTIYAFEGALAGTVNITAGGTLTLLEIAA